MASLFMLNLMQGILLRDNCCQFKTNVVGQPKWPTFRFVKPAMGRIQRILLHELAFPLCGSQLGSFLVHFSQVIIMDNKTAQILLHWHQLLHLKGGKNPSRSSFQFTAVPRKVFISSPCLCKLSFIFLQLEQNLHVQQPNIMFPHTIS